MTSSDVTPTGDFTIARLIKKLDDAQARLDNTLDLLVRSERQNHRLAAELSQAHREIASLITERDTWRANTGR